MANKEATGCTWAGTSADPTHFEPQAAYSARVGRIYRLWHQSRDLDRHQVAKES